LAVLVFAIGKTSIYTVGPDEEGVVLRFGAFIDRTPPGLHGKLPFGIDQVIPIKVRRQLTEEFGFRTQPERTRQSSNRTASDESNMLTGDLNTAVVEWVVQYRIEDPEKYLFKVRNSSETFRDMSEAVMRETVGDRTVNEVLTVGRQEITVVVQEKLQRLCNLYEIGIHVDQVVLQDVTPPAPVKPAFNEVNQAEQERAQLISEAQAEYNRVVPRAKGEAQQTILAAEGYGLDRVNRAKGEAARFESLYTSYRKAPEVTRTRIYLETMREILPKTGKKVVVDDDVRGMLPLLNLDSSPTASRRQEGGQ
jgi:membrane protease subunit HflK